MSSRSQVRTERWHVFTSNQQWQLIHENTRGSGSKGERITNKLKLMCILAHPDDESLCTGGILAKYAAEGVETYLVTATRGERGWFGNPKDYPGLTALGKIREAELLAAAAVLGLRRVEFLDYLDGDLDQAPAAEAVAKIWDRQTYYRAFSLVNGGRAVEDDLFAGLG